MPGSPWTAPSRRAMRSAGSLSTSVRATTPSRAFANTSAAMIPADGDIEAVLHALPEPTLVVAVDGHVTFANLAAQARLALDVGAESACDLTALSPGENATAGLRTYLRRCSGSRSPLLGALELRDAEGRTARFRCYGCLLDPARNGVPARLLLRLVETGDERFSVLAQKVRD